MAVISFILICVGLALIIVDVAIKRLVNISGTFGSRVHYKLNNFRYSHSSRFLSITAALEEFISLGFVILGANVADLTLVLALCYYQENAFGFNNCRYVALAVVLPVMLFWM